MSEISAITRMRERRITAIEGMRAIITAADAEGREELTGEEQGSIEKFETEIRSLDEQIDLRERVAGIQPQLVGKAADALVEETGEAAAERRGRTSGDPLQSEEYRAAFTAYLRGDATPEQRTMLLAPATGGGYTVPQSFWNRLYEYKRQMGVIRNLATVFSTGGGESLTLPTLTNYGTSAWLGEGDAFSESDNTFGQVTFGAYKVGHLIKISTELLQDSAFDLESLIARVFGTNLARAEQTAFVSGNGTNKPTGITAAVGGASVGKTASGATAITVDETLDLVASVAQQYRVPSCAFVAADATIMSLRKIKTGVASDLRYLWQESAVAGEPPTLFGYRFFTDPDFPAMTTGNKSMAFGDWSAYYIREVTGVQVQRLNERYADNGLIGFILQQRLDAKLIDTNAIKLLQQA